MSRCVGNLLRVLNKCIIISCQPFICIVIFICYCYLLPLCYILSSVRGVNSGVGGRDPSDFGLGVVGVSQGGRRGSWTGFGKHYSVFCTESMLENVFL